MEDGVRFRRLSLREEGGKEGGREDAEQPPYIQIPLRSVSYPFLNGDAIAACSSPARHYTARAGKFLLLFNPQEAHWSPPPGAGTGPSRGGMS